MLNFSMLPPIKGGKDEFRKIERIAVNDEVVLTTEQLSNFYACKVIQIQQNFHNNSKHFIEGKHYFKLIGEDLKTFKDNLHLEEIEVQISPMTRTLYLWTKRGVARHSKMLGTEEAWKVFEKMEDTFFRFGVNDVETIRKEIQEEIKRLEREQFNLRSERGKLECEQFNLEQARLALNNSMEEKRITKSKLLNDFARSATDDDLRNELIRQAANLLLGKSLT